MQITIDNIQTSDLANHAWDCDCIVTLDDGRTIKGALTLAVGEYSGKPEAWGEIGNWMSSTLERAFSTDLDETDRDALDAIEHAASKAIRASGVEPSGKIN